jgi:hypothetical protein
MDLSPNYGKSKPTNSPNTPIHLNKEKTGPSNPTGNTFRLLGNRMDCLPYGWTF